MSENKNNNAKCVICGKDYHLCMSCRDKIASTPWKVLTDTSEHYKVYQVVNGYRGGIYDKDVAKNALSNIDISDRNTYLDCVNKILDEILDDVKVDNTSINDTEDVVKIENDESFKKEYNVVKATYDKIENDTTDK